MILVDYACWLTVLFGKRGELVSCRSQMMRTAGDSTFDRAAVSFPNTAALDIVASSNQIKKSNLAPCP